MYDIIELNGKDLKELRDITKELEIPKFEALKKQDLIYKILDSQATNPPKGTDKKNTSSKSQKMGEDDFNEDNNGGSHPEQPSRTEQSYHESEKFSLPVDPVISSGETRGDQPQPQETPRQEKKSGSEF